MKPKETKLTLEQVTEMWQSGERTMNENKPPEPPPKRIIKEDVNFLGFHLHKYQDVIEYKETAIKDNEIPFIAYEKCIYCDRKRKCVQGWIDVADVMKDVMKEIRK